MNVVINMFIVLSVRIAGNGASEKNLKDGVCAQFEKNFAKSKWRVRILPLVRVLVKYSYVLC